jgi:hypothetical protein
MAEGVPAAKLPKLIAKVVQVYKGLAQKDETLQEAMERAGSRKFIEALAPYSQDAAGGGEDPFGGLDSGDGAGGGGGPAVETPDDEMAFDKEPAVEDFDAESLEGSGEDTLAVDDVAEAPLDEPLALEMNDGDALVSEELDGDVAIDGDSVSEGLEQDSLGGDAAAGDDDLSITEELEPESLAPASRQAPALVSDDDDLSLDAFQEETVGNGPSSDDGGLELAELETEGLEDSGPSGNDAIELDELPEDTGELDFDPKATAAAAAGAADDDFESIDPGGDALAAPAVAPKAVPAAASKAVSAPAPSKPAAVAPVLEDELLDEEAAGAEEVEGEAAVVRLLHQVKGRGTRNRRSRRLETPTSARSFHT